MVCMRHSDLVDEKWFVARAPNARPSGGFAAKRISAVLDLPEIYGLALLYALAAYAILGRGFAYVGVAPFYVGEMLLTCGVVILLRLRTVLATLTMLPAMAFSLLLIFVVCRTIPYLSQYGVDAVRDSVIVVYGVFAFVVAGLLLDDPTRVSRVVGFLRKFTGLYVFLGPLAYLINESSISQSLPKLPGADVSIISLRPGELGVHLAACAIMAIVELRSATVAWITALCLGAGIVASQNRGGFLAILIPVAVALSLTGRWRGVIPALLGVLLAFGIAYATNVTIPMNRDDGRSVGARQIVDNLVSLVDSSGGTQQDDTKLWREAWWREIENYTLHGSYFWTGKGFGVNLSQADFAQPAQQSHGHPGSRRRSWCHALGSVRVLLGVDDDVLRTHGLVVSRSGLGQSVAVYSVLLAVDND